MHKSLLRREQFPITDHLIYLNHAAVGALPSDSARAIEQHMRERRDYGALYWREWFEEYVLLRVSAAKLLGCSPDEISILKNTTEGLSFVAEGLAWNEGDNVITTDTEYPANYVPWKRLERKGVECRLITTRDGVFSTEDLAALIDDRTRLVSISSVSFHNGFTPDLVAIGKLCEEKKVLFCVDAIQSLGALAIDVRAAKISFLAAGAQKWLLGPDGIALFYCAASARDTLDVLESGASNTEFKGSFIGVDTNLLSDGRRFEGGSLNTGAVYALRASIDLINDVSPVMIEAEILHLANALTDRMIALGFTLRSPLPIRSGIVSFSPPESVDVAKVRKLIGRRSPRRGDPISLLHIFLEKEKVICSPREGMLRFSPHFYNEEREFDHVVRVLKKAID